MSIWTKTDSQGSKCLYTDFLGLAVTNEDGAWRWSAFDLGSSAEISGAADSSEAAVEVCMSLAANPVESARKIRAAALRDIEREMAHLQEMAASIKAAQEVDGL